MIISGTEHRPTKLGGYGDSASAKLMLIASTFLSTLPRHELHVISGMALGWDQALAKAAIQLGVPFTAAVPFVGQEGKWPMSSQAEYQSTIARAAYVQIVCPGGYSARSMQVRNEWMVDNSDAVLAMWDGSTGGTYNCVQYALHRGKQIINLWKAEDFT